MVPLVIRSIGDDNFGREVFDGYVAHLQEKLKEKERKREDEKVISIFWVHDYYVLNFVAKLYLRLLYLMDVTFWLQKY